MRVKKRLVVVADILCDEEFDTTELLLCEDMNYDILDTTPFLVLEGTTPRNLWEIEDYVVCEEVTLSNEVEQ